MIETFHKPGRWLRVNTHTHTVNSDGTYTPEEAVARYRDTLRYHALAITDHRLATPVDGLVADGADFCVIPGNELDGVDPETGMYHMVALGVIDHQDFCKDFPLQAAIDWVNARDGLAIFAHPYWSGQRHAALTSVRGAVGVEVYNNVCRLLNGKGTALAHWDALLEDGQRVWGVASDDVHFRPRHGFGGDAWIMVRAEANTAQDILAAIKAGDFYASTGPDILDMQRDSQRLYVRTSPAASITFSGAAWRGVVVRPAEGAETLTDAEYDLSDGQYVRVTVTDTGGRMAWSQPVFLAD
ncbi:MAG: CehA/McbA family metallohydrolase [Anaerolineae bacterium]